MLVGTGLLAVIGTLTSFSDGDKEKMKRYQVIQHSGGNIQEYDTVVPMSSDYTVEQFLKDKGISSENLQIIRMNTDDRAMFQAEDDGTPHLMIVKELHVSDGITGNDDGEEVRIRCTIGPDGKMEALKTVNVKEVPLTEEEILELEQQNGKHAMHISLDLDPGEDLQMIEKEENVEIKCEIDENGEIKARKWVNGEEVPVSEEEMQQFRVPGGDGKEMMIRLETRGDSGIEEIEMPDEMIREIEVEIEELMDVMDSGETHSTRKVIIRKSDGEQEVIELDGESNLQWVEKTETNVQVTATESGEDFTIVMITENVNPDAEAQSETKKVREEGSTRINVFPNPSEGKVTIRLEQSEKAKTSLEISDMNGKVVFREHPGKFSGTYEKEVDLKKFGSGTYLLTITQGTDVHTNKIVVK